MRHANIDLNVFDEPEFSEASLTQVGIWLKLYAFCARKENGGIIQAAAAWSDSHCQRLIGCSRSDLDNSPLWNLRPGGSLNLYHYNLIAEDWSKKARKTQHRAASARSEAKTAAARKNAEKGGRPCKIITLPSARS